MAYSESDDDRKARLRMAMAREQAGGTEQTAWDRIKSGARAFGQAHVAAVTRGPTAGAQVAADEVARQMTPPPRPPVPQAPKPVLPMSSGPTLADVPRPAPVEAPSFTKPPEPMRANFPQQRRTPGEPEPTPAPPKTAPTVLAPSTTQVGAPGGDKPQPQGFGDTMTPNRRLIQLVAQRRAMSGQMSGMTPQAFEHALPDGVRGDVRANKELMRGQIKGLDDEIRVLSRMASGPERTLTPEQVAAGRERLQGQVRSLAAERAGEPLPGSDDTWTYEAGQKALPPELRGQKFTHPQDQANYRDFSRFVGGAPSIDPATGMMTRPVDEERARTMKAREAELSERAAAAKPLKFGEYGEKEAAAAQSAADTRFKGAEKQALADEGRRRTAEDFDRKYAAGERDLMLMGQERRAAEENAAKAAADAGAMENSPEFAKIRAEIGLDNLRALATTQGIANDIAATKAKAEQVLAQGGMKIQSALQHQGMTHAVQVLLPQFRAVAGHRLMTTDENRNAVAAYERSIDALERQMAALAPEEREVWQSQLASDLLSNETSGWITRIFQSVLSGYSDNSPNKRGERATAKLYRIIGGGSSGPVAAAKK